MNMEKFKIILERIDENIEIFKADSSFEEGVLELSVDHDSLACEDYLLLLFSNPNFSGDDNNGESKVELKIFYPEIKKFKKIEEEVFEIELLNNLKVEYVNLEKYDINKLKIKYIPSSYGVHKFSEKLKTKINNWWKENFKEF